MSDRKQLHLYALRAFEVFGRHKRMVAAAAELNVTHGAISRQIRLLQDVLGVALVEGPKAGLRLTPAGAKLAASLSRAFDDMADALTVVRATEEQGLRISCLGTFAMRWLIPRLPRFYQAHPGVSVVISESFAPVDFQSGEHDAAIRMGVRLPGCTAFLEEWHGPVASADFIAARAEEALIGTWPRLSTRTYPGAWDEWAAGTDQQGIAPGSETFFDHTYYMLAAANAGLGTAIGTWALVQPDIHAGHLEAPRGFRRTPTDYLLIRNPRSRHSGLAAFETWLLQEGAAFQPPPGARI